MPNARIETHRNAILRPTRAGEKKGLFQTCGVFKEDGRNVETAHVSGLIGRFSRPCPCPAPEGLPYRKGRWLYAGIAYPHFGHALIFSTARLWALAQLEAPVDGILFFDRTDGAETRQDVPKHVASILELLGVNLPVFSLGTDEQVEELLVPEQGISTSQDLFAGLPEYRDFIRAATDRIPAQDGGDRLYLSRTKLGPGRRGVLYEDRLEAELAKLGYTAFHPQDHSMAHQISVLKSARHIIGIDGSALHMAAFAVAPQAHVAVLSRRPYFGPEIAKQIHAFSGAKTHEMRLYSRLFRPSPGLPGPMALCDINFGNLGQTLAEHGFLDRDPSWKPVPEKQVMKRLAGLEDRLKTKFIPVPGAP